MYAAKRSPAVTVSCSFTMLYRSNTARVLCPVKSIAIRSGTPARIKFRAAVRRPIMQEAMGHLRLPTRIAEGRPPGANRHAVAAKHARVAGLPALMTPLEHRSKRRRNRQHAAGPRFRPARRQAMTPRGNRLVPHEVQDLVPAPPRVVRKIQDVLIGGGGLGAHLEVLVCSKNPSRGGFSPTGSEQRHPLGEARAESPIGTCG